MPLSIDFRGIGPGRLSNETRKENYQLPGICYDPGYCHVGTWYSTTLPKLQNSICLTNLSRLCYMRGQKHARFGLPIFLRF